MLPIFSFLFLVYRWVHCIVEGFFWDWSLDRGKEVLLESTSSPSPEVCKHGLLLKQVGRIKARNPMCLSPLTLIKKEVGRPCDFFFSLHISVKSSLFRFAWDPGDRTAYRALGKLLPQNPLLTRKWPIVKLGREVSVNRIGAWSYWIQARKHWTGNQARQDWYWREEDLRLSLTGGDYS